MTPRWLLGAALLLSLQAASAQPPPEAGNPAPRNTRHALIIGIGEYEQPEVAVLAGIGHDMASARRMAQAMAIPAANMVVIRDRAATAARIRAEIAKLAARIAPGDRVFIYYSGHGTRWYDPATRSDGCTEGLLAADSQAITNVEMARLLKELAAKTDKLLVFYDACFSGGVAAAPLLTRSLAGARLTPKFAASSAARECAKPSNFRTRSLALVLQQAGGLPENTVHIAASRPDEVSFDSSAQGGFATVAWRDCLLGQARDLDRSGGVTVEEVTRCAQAKLSAALANQPGISGQHLTIGGNPSFVPAWMGAAFTTKPAPGSVSPALAEAPAPAPALAIPPTSPGAASTAAPPATAGASTPPALPAEILAEIHRQRHGARFVDLQLKSKQLRIARDALELDIVSLHSGYVYVALAGSDDKSLYLLFPNALDSDNHIKAGQTLSLPRRHWEVLAGGPAGRDRLLVIVADAPRDLSDLAAEPSGPFLKTLLDEGGRARLQWLLVNGTPSAGCAEGAGAANRAPDPICSDAYGAALANLDEVR